MTSKYFVKIILKKLENIRTVGHANIAQWVMHAKGESRMHTLHSGSCVLKVKYECTVGHAQRQVSSQNSFWETRLSEKQCKSVQNPPAGGGVSKIIVCPTIIQEAYTHTVCVRMCVKNCGNGSARWFECTVIYYSIEKKFKNIYTKESFSYF